MPHTEKILIVDDEPRMCDSLSDLLSTQGYKIETCFNGADALEYLTTEPFDLVLLDIAMGDLDGFQVMERMARHNLDLPVIIMTGNASMASAIEALRKGAYDYLRKPFEPEELFISAKNALTQKLLKQDCRRLDRKFRESEERFRRLAENAKDMIYRMKLPDGHYEFVNSASIELLGYSPVEFYQSPLLIRDVIHPDWIHYFEAQWENLLLGIMPPSYEYKIIHKSGTERWLHQRNVLILDDDGHPVAIEGVVSDITERKRMEEALNESERKFRSIFDRVRIGLMITNGDGVVLDCNPHFGNIFGVEKERYLGLNLLEKLPEGPVRDTLTEATAGSGKSHYEGPYTSIMNGKNLDIYVSTEKIAPDFLITILADITERKQIMAALRESEERFRSLFHSIPSVAVQGYGPDGVTQYWNKASERLYGYSSQEAVGNNLLDLIIPEEMRENVTRAIQQMVETGQPIPPSELSLKRKDGSRVAVYSSHAIVRIPGREPELFCMDIDLTERKREQKERESLEIQNQQLQKADSLSRMAGAIAHHFNNQLMVVMGNLELLMGGLTAGDADMEHLSQAMTATHKASEISSLMLTYLGKAITNKEPMDVCEVCRHGLPLLRATLPVTIRLETILPSPGPVINGNARQIQQVLSNLITNASESYDAQGTVYLTVETVSAKSIPSSHRYPIDWEPEDKTYACLEVTDTGCGIAEEDIEKVFDPFFTTKFIGRGLGLPVVLGIMKAHNGAITVESKSGKQTKFRAFFRVSVEPVILEPKKTAQVPVVKGHGSVLLVEDTDSVRKITRSMLMRLGFTVFGARDGFEALKIFTQYRDEIQCVISDLTMPLMDGWETMAALRKLSPEIPVILTSGHDERQVMGGDHPVRPDAFLHKPFTRKVLADVIQQTLKKK